MKIIEATGDGACLFNAFSIGLAIEILSGRINDEVGGHEDLLVAFSKYHRNFRPPTFETLRAWLSHYNHKRDIEKILSPVIFQLYKNTEKATLEESVLFELTNLVFHNLDKLNNTNISNEFYLIDYTSCPRIDNLNFGVKKPLLNQLVRIIKTIDRTQINPDPDHKRASIKQLLLAHHEFAILRDQLINHFSRNCDYQRGFSCGELEPVARALSIKLMENNLAGFSDNKLIKIQLYNTGNAHWDLTCQNDEDALLINQKEELLGDISSDRAFKQFADIQAPPVWIDKQVLTEPFLQEPDVSLLPEEPTFKEPAIHLLPEEPPVPEQVPIVFTPPVQEPITPPQDLEPGIKNLVIALQNSISDLNLPKARDVFNQLKQYRFHKDYQFYCGQAIFNLLQDSDENTDFDRFLFTYEVLENNFNPPWLMKINNDETTFSSLHWAVLHNDWDYISNMDLNEFTKLNRVNTSNISPILLAAQQGKWDYVRLLAKQNTYAHDRLRYSDVIKLAIKNNQPDDIIDQLLKLSLGAPWLVKRDEVLSFDPLHLAVLRNDIPEITKILNTHPQPIMQTNFRNNRTPVEEAVASNNLEVLKAFLSIKPVEKNTPFYARAYFLLSKRINPIEGKEITEDKQRILKTLIEKGNVQQKYVEAFKKIYQALYDGQTLKGPSFLKKNQNLTYADIIKHADKNPKSRTAYAISLINKYGVELDNPIGFLAGKKGEQRAPLVLDIYNYAYQHSFFKRSPQNRKGLHSFNVDTFNKTLDDADEKSRTGKIRKGLGF